MASIMFWNVQRLGGGTDAEIQLGINRVAAAQGCDYEIYCELTTACTVLTPNNLTYRKKNPLQLCYGARRQNGNQLNMTRLDPTVTNEYSTQAALQRYGGDRNFKNWTDRAPADLGVLGGANIYAIHAPAYALGGERTLAYLACYLNNLHGNNPWLLIGDFNVSPDSLGASPVSINLANLIRRTGGRTHKRYGELDYVLTNITSEVKVRRVKANFGFIWSDHYAIWVQY